ncbi:outer membrane lipoprotein-sorting protein [Paraburkholderia bannensis]|uniref:outer membrane lipoprotein-sorting protein n=1 Tax=Paraburkholderia bannensis TaxID=765414 RepID=UPI000481E956|nr:outer membrane lipoprotein-sorting protein [Paraburkholderia bannensis]
MRLRWFNSICFFLVYATTTPAFSATDGQQLLAASDVIRVPGQSFLLNAALTEYRAGKEIDSNALTIYTKPDSGGGTFRTLVRFIAPARDVGKLMLKSGDDLWFYDPANQASLRISPDQRLLGQESNGDVVTANFSHDYAATLVGEEDVMDGDRQTRHCYRLSLAGKTPNLIYRRIDMWLDASNARPVKARFYADGDRLLKTAFYRRYQQELGAMRPTEVVIIDGLDSGWVTVMRFDNYAWRDIPDAWMQRDYLARFRPE